MRTIIIDDEAPARSALAELLQQFCPQVKIIGMAEDGETGYSILQTLKPDLVFLDIEMPGMSGFELLQKFGSFNFHLVFVSAYNHYAFRAFEFSALDYLEKPVNPQRLVKCVFKATEQTEIRQLKSQFDLLSELLERKEAPDHRIVFATQTEIVFSWIRNLIRIDADMNCSMIKITEQTNPIRIAKNIGEYEKLLASHPQLMRIHRSHLVNLRYIQRFLREDDCVQMTDGFKIPVASARRDELLERMSRLGDLN